MVTTKYEQVFSDKEKNNMPEDRKEAVELIHGIQHHERKSRFH